MAHPRIDHAAEPSSTMQFEESVGPRPWRLFVLPEQPSPEVVHTLATELVSAVRAEVNEVVVDVEEVSSPPDGLALVLHRGAEVLAWAGGTLVVDGASPELADALRTMGDPAALVLHAA